MSVERFTTRPEPEDVLFDSVSADEREACLIYEVSRESPSLRRVFENGWHTTNPLDLPDEAPPFLRSQRAKETYGAVIRKASLSEGDLTNHDPETLAHIHWSLFMQNWGPLLAWNPSDDWVDENIEETRVNVEAVEDPPTTHRPNSPSTPYQKLPKSRRTKLPAASLIRLEPLNAWSTAGRASTVTTYDGAYFTFFIRFGGHTDKELAEAFKNWQGRFAPRNSRSRNGGLAERARQRDERLTGSDGWGRAGYVHIFQPSERAAGVS